METRVLTGCQLNSAVIYHSFFYVENTVVLWNTSKSFANFRWYYFHTLTILRSFQRLFSDVGPRILSNAQNVPAFSAVCAEATASQRL
jgi:hypothetical protein